MCRHCEEEEPGQTRKTVRDYTYNGKSYLRRFREGNWILHAREYWDGHWVDINVRYCPWCGRDLEAPRQEPYISLDDRVADLEFAVKKLQEE